MDVNGYAEIKKDAQKIISPVSLDNFRGQVCRVLEFSVDGSALIMDPQATGIAMVEKEEIERSFRCSVEGVVVCPPDLGFYDKMLYVSKCMARKGGYDETLKKMVIYASIAKGKFTDNFLWQCEFGA